VGGRISDEDIERVRSAVDIVEVIGGYLPLKRSGRSFKALCPFHSEKTPSFHVFPESQLFKCFGCGKAGTVFSFLMAQDRMEFHEAVRAMAERVGLTLREEGGEGDRGSGERDALIAALRAAMYHFRGTLNSGAGEKARDYLTGRGIGPALVDRFLLGYAPGEWDGLLKALRGQFPEPLLEKAGLVALSQKGSRYDRFRDRILFPIADVRGRVVGFGGRAMPGAPDDTPKYVNSPETPVYRKGQILYGLHLAREENLQELGVVIVEGYTDVILLHGAGVTNACAACGTALTPEHVRLLKRYTNRIHLVFDGDAAGVRAMDRGLELLAGEDVDLSLVVLPGDEDPADFVGRCGADAFREALRGGRDLCDFKLAVVAGKEDLSTPGGMARAADEMLALVRKVRHPVRRGEYLRRTAEGLRTSEEALRARLSQQERPAPAAGPAGSPAPAAGPRALHEGLVVEALLGDAALAGGPGRRCRRSGSRSPRFARRWSGSSRCSSEGGGRRSPS